MKNIHQHHSQVFSKLIGTPYQQSDCWDIVKKFYKLVFKEEINLNQSYKVDSLGRSWAIKSSKILLSNESKFKRVKNPDFGDIIVLRIYGIPAHVGIFLDKNSMLHTSEKTGCVIESMEKWKCRIEGYYRWPKFV